ncbi:hypothetical protein [Streptomyces sp. Go-475]|uniref:hypothetical protein n=1 Tax=Streptomyces sp. Go-475 TaxID=2072505 RepID=UPI000DF045A4|nr:hypothetical protein [Streptomyces sp. Go-475]AXE83717.1 hypothetical protein C1703_01825 [Streptomyces sp. Go-475]
MRKVVTGHDGNGRSVVVSDGPIPRGREFTSLLPAPGGTRFVVLAFPPDSAPADPAFDAVAFDQEQRADSPNLVEPAGRTAEVIGG